MRLLIVTFSVVAFTLTAAKGGSLTETPPPGQHFKLAASAHEGAESFSSGRPVIGTSYFYWYDIHAGSHIRNADGSDALTTHPPDEAMKDLSYKSPHWHLSQLQDVARAGIDFIMPVYWGVPGKYHEGTFAWSFVGLPPLVEAHDRMLAAHRKDARHPAPAKIGLFYDTSTLRINDVNGPGRSRHIDLTTPEGREWFYVTIRDYFSMIPPDKWARVDGRPIIFLYAGEFAKAIDDKLFDDARARFQRDFGTDFFLIRHADWPGKADGWYIWGGATNLTIGDLVAGLGPGYDHSAVPNRKPRVVDREEGRFYDRQWTRLLSMNPARRPWMVHVETWNEWHEGTDIARSREYGDKYIRATARYARLFHDGARLKLAGAYRDADRVRWTAREAAGLTLRPSRHDGRWEQTQVNGVPAVTSIASEVGQGRYLYFDVDDAFMYDEMNRDAELTITFRDDGGCDSFWIQYDNGDSAIEPAGGAFRNGPAFRNGGTDTWRTVTATLPDVRFVNRTNQADFRLAITGGQNRLTISEVIVRPAAKRGG